VLGYVGLTRRHKDKQMRTLGLIGGMSWESTVPYYRLINETVKQQLGGLHSAKLVLYSVDFFEIEQLQMQGDWEKAGQILGEAALALNKAGAERIVLDCRYCISPTQPPWRSARSR